MFLSIVLFQRLDVLIRWTRGLIEDHWFEMSSDQLMVKTFLMDFGFVLEVPASDVRCISPEMNFAWITAASFPVSFLLLIPTYLLSLHFTFRQTFVNFK